MDKLVYIGLVTLLLLIIIYLIWRSKRERHKTYDQLRKQYGAQLEKDLKESVKKLAEIKEESLVTTERYSKSLERLQEVIKEINDKEHFNQTLYKLREEELDNLIETKKKAELERVDREVEEWAMSAQDAAAFDSIQYQKGLQELSDLKKKELDELTATIDDYKARRDVINQEILRARAIEEQQDFYRVQLEESSKRDIQLINSIRKDFSKIDILDKLIYDGYVKKPVDEMVKRVLGGRAPSGIYKITRLKTGEIYIGKSTDIKSRWQQHAKSAFHCGTISHSILHTTMEKDGIENFTWELLEEVPKDKLGDRERYWIDFYDSKNYGLNEKAGG
jgi:hypothetical protein